MPSVLLTTYTSFCFAAVSYVGFIKKSWMGPWFFSLSVLSFFNHLTSDTVTRMQSNILLRYTDKTVAHAITVISAYDALQKKRTVYWISLLYVIYMFKIGRCVELPGRPGELVHCSTHIVSSLGCISLLI